MTLTQFDAEQFLRAELPHDLNLDPAARYRLDALIAIGANNLAQEPNRMSEAKESMRTLVQHLQGQSKSLQEALITEKQFDFSLKTLCPLFPFC
jgi:hypothetical protein